jgi:tight adherence protein B
VSAAPGLAFGAGVAGALALREAWAAAASRAPRAAVRAAAVLEAVTRLGREGRDPGAAERRLLLIGGALAAFVLGATLAGPVPALLLAGGGPPLVARLLRLRRERYRCSVEEGAGALAVALADALGAGRSLRVALAEAAQALPGPVGSELRRVAVELAAGARTDDALEALRARVRSHRIDTVVAACLLQRRAGGDLGRLLRDLARAFEDHARLQGELRAATAQARFTGLIVVLLPAGGAMLAELASPGFLVGLWSSFLTAWLVGIAVALQVGAALLIRRLGRVRW